VRKEIEETRIKDLADLDWDRWPRIDLGKKKKKKTAPRRL
jgi:hypothetical protein